MRIAKYLAASGLGSRRKCEELVAQGRVRINGTIVGSPAEKVDPDSDVVEFDGKKVSPQRLVCYALNKPVGYTTSTKDAHAEKLVTELVPAEPPVWPAGRLDKETSGLLIMTNDGVLTQRLTHPSFEKEKEYIVTTDRDLSEFEVGRIQRGVVLEDGPVRPDLFEQAGERTYRIVIHEGRKRIIRRLFASFKTRVDKLERIRVGRITLDDLKPGRSRELTKTEIESFYQK